MVPKYKYMFYLKKKSGFKNVIFWLKDIQITSGEATSLLWINKIIL